MALTLDPSGASIGLPLVWLEGSPFADYLIPGVVLTSLLGVVPLLAAYGVWTSRPWSWAVSLGIGAALLVWLAIEIAVIGYQAQPPLQLVYGVVAAVIILSTTSPSVRRHLRARRRDR